MATKIYATIVESNNWEWISPEKPDGIAYNFYPSVTLANEYAYRIFSSGLDNIKAFFERAEFENISHKADILRRIEETKVAAYEESKTIDNSDYYAKSYGIYVEGIVLNVYVQEGRLMDSVDYI